MSRMIPVPYWMTLASIWLALAALATLGGNLFLTAVAVACLGHLGLTLRQEVLHRQRMTVLSTTLALVDAKVDARLRRVTGHDRP